MAGLYSQNFIRAVNFVLGEEGLDRLSLEKSDKGNWTGGVVGAGELKGTKWGISAASYPQLDIAALTRESAVAIYYKDFWCPLRGDQMGPRIGQCVLDCAVNQGLPTAVRLLQQALTLPADGEMGPVTISAVKTLDQDILIVAFLRERALRYAQSKQLATYGKGWFARLFDLCQASSR